MNRREVMAAAAAGVALTAALPALAGVTSATTSLVGLARDALARHKDRISNLDRLAVADFGVHSSKPRFHLIDVKSGKTQSFLVAHGRGSDPAHTGWLKTFSNLTGSEATSQGAYVTDDAYVGKHGHSRRLIGLDADNSNALARGIVIHSAWYVSDDMASRGAIGRSEGCFALSEKDLSTVMDQLGSGSLLVAVRA